MKLEMMRKFKTMFEQKRHSLLYSNGVVNEDFHILKDDYLDEIDLASSELETSMRIRLRNREALFLKKIDEALDRIREGTFGECEECGEDIELRRLEARPTTTLCVECKEEQERMESLHIDGHRFKSLGAKFRVRFGE